MVQVAGQVVSQVRLTRKKAQVESWVFAFDQKNRIGLGFSKSSWVRSENFDPFCYVYLLHTLDCDRIIYYQFQQG